MVLYVIASVLREAILGFSEEIASGKEHACPGGWCQGMRPRNDMETIAEIKYSLEAAWFFLP